MNPLLVVNPAAGGGRARRRFEALTRAIAHELGPFERAFTERPGDAVRLAGEAAAAGRPLVVAVGGDGTASEVVDGLVSAGAGPAFGFLACGTGGDLARTLSDDRSVDLASQVRALARADERRCDVGRVEYAAPGGARRARHFVNVAGVGLAGRVVAQGDRLPRWLPARATYLVAGATALAGWRDAPVRWRVDGGAWRDDRVTALSVCNGRFFGGGMLVAPAARLDDGLFDVVVWRGLGLADLALRHRSLRDGSHVTLRCTEVLRAASLDVEPAGGAPVLLDVDGEQPGTIPARFTILPHALRVRGATAG